MSAAARSEHPKRLKLMTTIRGYVIPPHNTEEFRRPVAEAPDLRSVSQAAGNDGLDAEPEPAIAVAADRAAEPEGHEDDGEDHDHPVDQRLPDVQPRQQLGQEDQESGAEHRPEERGETAEDDDGNELDGEEEAEFLRIEEAHEVRAQGAS